MLSAAIAGTQMLLETARVGNTTSPRYSKLTLTLLINRRAFMRPTIAILAAAISLASSSTFVHANPDADYDAATKQAKADYSAAKEACQSMKGNDKDVCLKQAKADYTAATEDAKVAKKTSEAQADASKATMEAEYKVAKEKCDALSGDAKSACLAQAKAQYRP